jgi:hypothetical protein
MHVYFVDSQVPELAALAPSERRRVMEQALNAISRHKPLVKWFPQLFCALGTATGWFALPFAVVAFTGNSIIHNSLSIWAALSVLGGGACGLTAGLAGRQLLIHKLRPYLRGSAGDRGVGDSGDRAEGK